MVHEVYASIRIGTIVVGMTVSLAHSIVRTIYNDIVLPYGVLMLQILELIVSQSLLKFIEQLVEEDGSVKDSAVGQ